MTNSFDDYTLETDAYGDGGDDFSFGDSLINSQYDFVRYYQNATKYSENGATVVFTGKQFVFLKNGNDGQQGHVFSFARTYLALQGDHSELGFTDACRVESNNDKKYMTMTFEAEGGPGHEIYKSIRFYPRIPLSPQEYASFELFCSIYGDVIKKCQFPFFVYDKVSKETLDIYDLDTLCEFLRNNIDEKAVPYENPKGERIVGVSNDYVNKGKTTP